MTEFPTPRRPYVWVVMGGLGITACAVFFLVGFDGPRSALAFGLVAFALTVVVIGWAVFRDQQRERVFRDQLARWTAQEALRSERLRIAGDLHDLASHGLGTITVRAVAAQLDGGAHRDALADIEKISREATQELRRMLTLLRDPLERAALSPTDNLASLSKIIEDACATGLSVQSRVDNSLCPSASTQLAMCAVVKEGLANAYRHAGPTSVAVAIWQESQRIHVEVKDAGPVPGWQPIAGSGFGLVGLRQRVENAGGVLDVTSVPDGFAVHASFASEETP